MTKHQLKILKFYSINLRSEELKCTNTSMIEWENVDEDYFVWIILLQSVDDLFINDLFR